MIWRDRPGAPPTGTILCDGKALAERAAKGLVFGGGADRFELFLVRQAGRVYGYVNECPHTHTPLDFQPDRFLNRAQSLLLCSTHGALFRIEDGYCVDGPCAGQSLTPVPVTEGDGQIVVG